MPKSHTVNVDPYELAEKMFEEKKIEFAKEIFSEIRNVLVFKEDERRVLEIRKKYTEGKTDAKVHRC